uniref:Uncharacterized protein n=1 Tax=Noccaea caerulescens TaxID=107243 RepID=A0A1J3K1E0_NOCCA
MTGMYEWSALDESFCLPENSVSSHPNTVDESVVRNTIDYYTSISENYLSQCTWIRDPEDLVRRWISLRVPSTDNSLIFIVRDFDDEKHHHLLESYNFKSIGGWLDLTKPSIYCIRQHGGLLLSGAASTGFFASPSRTGVNSGNPESGVVNSGNPQVPGMIASASCVASQSVNSGNPESGGNHEVLGLDLESVIQAAAASASRDVLNELKREKQEIDQMLKRSKQKEQIREKREKVKTERDELRKRKAEKNNKKKT